MRFQSSITCKRRDGLSDSRGTVIMVERGAIGRPVGARRTCFGQEGYVDILEERPGSDTSNPPGGLNQIVSGLAGLFSAQGVDKEQRFGELTSMHKKTGAIDGPLAFKIHNASFTLFGRLPTVCCRFRILTGHGHRPANSRFQWSDCTRTRREGQLHKNCATVEFSFRDWNERYKINHRSNALVFGAREAGSERIAENSEGMGRSFTAEICTSLAQFKNNSGFDFHNCCRLLLRPSILTQATYDGWGNSPVLHEESEDHRAPINRKRLIHCR